MAKITGFNFGFIVVDEKQYAHDIVILPDGTVKERELRKGRLGSHSIARGEIESLSRGQPDIILIGTGVQGMAKLARDAEFYLMEPNPNVMLMTSPQAVRKFNQCMDDGDKVAALIHVTC
jgi:hypothetical protein